MVKILYNHYIHHSDTIQLLNEFKIFAHWSHGWRGIIPKLKYFCYSILSMEHAMAVFSVLGSRVPFGIGRAWEVKGRMAAMALSAP